MKKKVMAMISNMNDGGAQKVLLNQAKMFENDENVEFCIYSYERPTGSVYDEIIQKEKLNVVYLAHERHYFKMPLIGDIFNFFVTNWNWRKAIRTYNPDIIHTHVTEILRKSFLGIKASGNKRVYCTLHSNPYRYKGSSYWAARIAFNVFHFIPVCITEEQARMAIDHYKINSYRLVRNGTEFKNITEKIISKAKARELLHIPVDAFVVASVGRLNKIKNIDLLINCISGILKRNKNSFIIIAGDGPEKEHLKKLVEELNAVNNVIFTGNIENVIPIYCAADVFCMPSISEASPMALHEAQCCGLRCVISDGIPLENVFTNRVYALSIQEGIECWVEAIVGNDTNISATHERADFDISTAKNNLDILYRG